MATRVQIDVTKLDLMFGDGMKFTGRMFESLVEILNHARADPLRPNGYWVSHFPASRSRHGEFARSLKRLKEARIVLVDSDHEFGNLIRTHPDNAALFVLT